MDILSKIDELVLDSSIRVLKIEFAKDSIAVTVEELNTPAMTYKCVNEADAEFTANLWKLKPFLNQFKSYGLPTEQELERKFEVEKWEYFRNIPEDEITEDAEENLKKQIMARPSIEKIRIKKIELKQHKNQDESIIWYYQITCISVNRQTMFMEENQCVILESLIPPVPDKKQYGDFQNTLEQFFKCGRNHYLAYIEYLKTEREEKKRRYILEASQGKEFDPYVYEYQGFDSLDQKPQSVCKKCGTDVIWIKRILHRVFFNAWQLHGMDLHQDGLWSNLDAVILLRRHYVKIGMRDIMPLHPRMEPAILIENGACISCRKYEAEERSLF